MKQNNNEKLSALSEELSQNFENVSDVDDEQLKNEILNSKSEFVQVPEDLPSKSYQLERNANNFDNLKQKSIYKPIEFSSNQKNILQNFQSQPYSNLNLQRFMHKNNPNTQKEDNLISYYQKLLDEEHKEKQILLEKNKELNQQLQESMDKQYQLENQTNQKISNLENLNQKLIFEKQYLQEKIDLQSNNNSIMQNDEIQRKNFLIEDLQNKLNILQNQNSQYEQQILQNQNAMIQLQTEVQNLNSNKNLQEQKQQIMIKNLSDQLNAYNDQNNQLKQQIQIQHQQQQQLQNELNQMKIQNFQLSTQLDYIKKLNNEQNTQNFQSQKFEYKPQQDYQFQTQIQTPFIQELQPVQKSLLMTKFQESPMKQLKPIDNTNQNINFHHRNVKRQRHFQQNQIKEDKKINLEKVNSNHKFQNYDQNHCQQISNNKIQRKFPTQQEALENEIYEICEKRRLLNKQYHKLQHNKLKSGIMIRKKQQIEQDLLEINKEIATKKNQLRLLKLN